MPNIKFTILTIFQSAQFSIHIVYSLPPSICNLAFDRNLLNWGYHYSTRCLKIKSQEYFSWSGIGFQDSFLIYLQSGTMLMVPSFLRTIIDCLLVKFQVNQCNCIYPLNTLKSRFQVKTPLSLTKTIVLDNFMSMETIKIMLVIELVFKT